MSRPLVSSPYEGQTSSAGFSFYAIFAFYAVNLSFLFLYAAGLFAAL